LSALAERSAYAAALKEIPVGALILTTETAPSGERTLRYRIEHDSTPAAGTSCDYMHTVIPAYDFALAPQQMQKRSEPWPAGTRHFETTLAGVYAAGERIYATAECQYPRLGARVRLGMERLVM
ncbi:MAG: hypothetical protein O7G83_06615, partial [Proteobacteria bacterium]|nr:hypothetical protein [Pseudomonadota bacterium]